MFYKSALEIPINDRIQVKWMTCRLLGLPQASHPAWRDKNRKSRRMRDRNRFPAKGRWEVIKSELIAADRGMSDSASAADSRSWVCQHSKLQQRRVKKGKLFQEDTNVIWIKEGWWQHLPWPSRPFTWDAACRHSCRSLKDSGKWSLCTGKVSALGEKSFNFLK